MLQAFHLSQGKKRITYIWADDSNQQRHDSATSNLAGPQAAPSMDKKTVAMHAPQSFSRAFSNNHTSVKAAPNLDSDLLPDADADQLEQIPALHKPHHSKAAFSCGQPIIRRVSKGSAVQTAAAHSSEVEQQWSTQSVRRPKAVTVELSINALSSETVSRMLALSARTERRAESLIGKVQAIKTSCRVFLDSMPERTCADA